MLSQTHLIWQKDSARSCREGILGLDEDEVAQGSDGTSDGLAVESDLGRKLRARPMRGRKRRRKGRYSRQDEEEGSGYSAEGRHLGASIAICRSNVRMSRACVTRPVDGKAMRTYTSAREAGRGKILHLACT